MAKPDYDNPEDREFIETLISYKRSRNLTFRELTNAVRESGFPELRDGDLGRASSMTGRATVLCQRPGFREAVTQLLASTPL